MIKDGTLFDVAECAFHETEVCKLVGNFPFQKQYQKYKHASLALYRDDGLGDFKKVSRPTSGKIKKQFSKVFREHDLKLSIQCNEKIVNFIEVTLYLQNPSYHPNSKGKNKTIYGNKESYQPPSIIIQLPKSTELRIIVIGQQINIDKIYKTI